ncbi:MAG: DUF2721 domain-containing protein [Lysobacterales bacterium]
MDISLTTPSLLFPAISLLLLAYTNRFLALAAVIRGLHASYRAQPEHAGYLDQIQQLRTRVRLIRDMQSFGVFSLLLCTLSMFALFGGWHQAGQWLFGASLVAMALSLALSLIEIQRSVGALDLQLADLGGGQRGDRGAT